MASINASQGNPRDRLSACFRGPGGSVRLDSINNALDSLKMVFNLAIEKYALGVTPAKALS
ncbi:hypothetical protein N8586_00060 [Verrucomicrobiales bacterium]|nr:hypothetical protein [Verrucomicrobiales bacterium]